MLYALIGTGLLFIAIAFPVAKNNATNLLSGYYTLRESTEYWKGYFKTKEGEKVKLILNSDSKSYLFFAKMPSLSTLSISRSILLRLSQP